MHDLFFRVATHTFRVTLHHDPELDAQLASYTPFATMPQTGTPLFTLTEDNGLTPDTEGFDEIGQFDCGGANHGVYHNDSHYRFHISDTRKELTGVLECSHDFTSGRIRLYGKAPQRFFALNNALMILFAFASAPHATLLVHAAVVRQAGRGYLFLGRSGTGKSTHARLWLRHIAGSDLLNDDNPVLVLADRKATVYGSPWSGKTPCYRNESAPVGAITRLEQAPQNLIRRERPVAAFASLLSSCSTMIWDKATYDAICETVSGMARVVPSYHLQCLPDAEAAQLCHQTVACPS